LEKITKVDTAREVGAFAHIHSEAGTNCIYKCIWQGFKLYKTFIINGLIHIYGGVD
jgi:hypothetical protein